MPPAIERELEALVLADQLAGVRRSLSIAIPVNILLTVATFAVVARHGNVTAGAIWFSVATLVNLIRATQCWGPSWSRSDEPSEAVRSQLRWSAALAGLSGLVWACTTLLPSDPSSPEAAFHLIVGAGVTGGAIALGFAYAPVAICFVSPVLVANAIALFLAETVEQSFLAATVAIYLAALYRSAVQSEWNFRKTAWLRHEATVLARSLGEAHAEAFSIAEEMTYRAQHDSLTGLKNRAGFLLDLERKLAPSSPDCCLMLLDLDGFKSINDAFGHKTGDLVLREVASRILATVPPDTVVARLGGDEFAVAFQSGGASVSSNALAERLIGAVGASFGSFDAGRVGISIGIYEGPVTASEELLVFADEALYAAKKLGRNQCYRFDESLRQRRDIRRDSERDLPAALEDGRIEVWFQPIFGDGGARLDSVESLLRWQHPNHGWISPAEVVSASALAGHSKRLFGFIVDRACAMALRLRETGHADVTVAVNVSPREMSQLPVDAMLLERLRTAGLPNRALEIEITEETAIDIHAVEGKLATLSAAGIRIAIDDFGTGYSSLATLRQLHADRIKIDRSLVTGLSHAIENRSMLQAVISLGRAMNLDIVAEGVESADDVLTLRALGCPLMQGFHLGSPMPADDLLATISRPAADGTAATAA